MHLCTFRATAGIRLGAVVGENIVDLNLGYASLIASRGGNSPYETAAALVPPDSLSFLGQGEASLDAAREVIQAVQQHEGNFRGPRGEEVIFRLEVGRLGPPVFGPRKFICIGSNYYDLLRDMGRQPPQQPGVYARFSDTIIGPGEPIILPRTSTEVEYEAELAFVVGKKGKHISEEFAYEYIVGYTACNDVTCHDWYVADGNLGRAKNADSSGPLGPVLVTKEEIPDPHNLFIKLTMNGRLLQNSNTNQMVFSIPQIVSFLSRSFTLQPGDVVSTGSPAGLSWAHDPPAYLRVGAEITIEIERVGTLRNPVITEE